MSHVPPGSRYYPGNDDDDGRDAFWSARAAEFARPGSALRRASRSNPRSHPCPTCKRPDALTLADVRRGYQCDRCADAEEGAW